MALWIELHCDVQRFGTDPDDALRQLCETHQGESPGVLVRNTQIEFKRGRDTLFQIASERGWKREIRDGKQIWICAGCQKATG